MRNEKIFFKTVSMYIKGKHYSTLSILGPPQSPVCVWDWKWGAVLGGETCHRKTFYICKSRCVLLLGRAALPSSPAPPILPGR